MIFRVSHCFLAFSICVLVLNICYNFFVSIESTAYSILVNVDCPVVVEAFVIDQRRRLFPNSTPILKIPTTKVSCSDPVVFWLPSIHKRQCSIWSNNRMSKTLRQESQGDLSSSMDKISNKNSTTSINININFGETQEYDRFDIATSSTGESHVTDGASFMASRSFEKRGGRMKRIRLNKDNIKNVAHSVNLTNDHLLHKRGLKKFSSKIQERIRHFIENESKETGTINSTREKNLFKRVALSLIGLWLILKLLLGSYGSNGYPGFSNNFVYYESQIVQTSKIVDGKLIETERTERFKSNIPGLEDRMRVATSSEPLTEPDDFFFPFRPRSISSGDMSTIIQIER